MAAADLDTFLQSMRAGGSRAALSSYDLDAFSRLDPGDANIATQACVDRICSGTNDPRAVAIIDQFFRMETEPALRAALPRLPGNETKVAVLDFLIALRQRPADMRALIDVALHGQRSGQLAALRSLARTDFMVPQAEDTLYAATADAHEDVRFQAMTHLLSRRGLSQATEHSPSSASTIGPLLLSPLVSVYAQGAHLLGELLAASRAGQTPDTSGFPADQAADADRFLDRLSSGDLPPLSTFQGRTQSWAEELLLARMHEDAAAVQTLAAHGSERAREALAELADDARR